MLTGNFAIHFSPLRTTILDQMVEVARRQGVVLAPLTDELPLLDSGLDSLCIALLVAGLDDQLELDPFSGEDIEFPVTIGDFIRLYENVAA